MTLLHQLYDLLVSPVRTEKAFIAHEKGKYAFFIREETSKDQVKEAIEKLFNKKVLKVNIVASRTKSKGARKGQIGKKVTMKKAIVTLEKGSNLDEIFGSNNM
jgi:large subunit ribosomal protein L23